MRFAVRVPQAYCFASPDALLRVAEEAEALGFWGISVQDHLIADRSVSWCAGAHDPAGDDRVVYEAFQTLAYLAARTTQIKLVAGVIVLPFRNAILAAKELASLDVFSGGRLVIGLGVGARRGATRSVDGGQDLSAHARIAGAEFDALALPGHRGRLMDEGIEVMRALWADEVSTYEGDYYRFENLAVFPKPMQRPGPPLWIGGRSEAALERAVRLGDGWFPSQISARDYSEGVSLMKSLAAREGVAPPADRGLNIFAAVAPSDDEAHEAIHRALGHRFTEDGLRELTLSGSVDTLTERAQAYAASGVDAIDLKLLPPTLDSMLESMRLIASDVLPAV